MAGVYLCPCHTYTNKHLPFVLVRQLKHGKARPGLADNKEKWQVFICVHAIHTVWTEKNGFCARWFFRGNVSLYVHTVVKDCDLRNERPQKLLSLVIREGPHPISDKARIVPEPRFRVLHHDGRR